MIESFKTCWQWLVEWFTTCLLWVLDVKLPDNGQEGTQWHLEGAWLWNRHTLFLFAIFAVLSGIYVLYFYIRERSSARRPTRLFLTSLRLTLVFLVLLVMVFQLRVHFSRTSLPHLAIVIDRSASMATVDDYAVEDLNSKLQQRVRDAGFSTASRFNVARSLLLESEGSTLEELARSYTLRYYSMASAQQKQSSDFDVLVQELRGMEANGDSSQLGKSLRNVLDDLRGSRPAAIVVLSDGITTEGPRLSDAASYARSQAVPLHLVGIGNADKIRDLELADLLVDEIVFVNDYVDFDFKLTAYGLKGRSVELVLKNKNTGEVLDRRRVNAGDDGVAQREKMSHRPTEVGSIEYVVEVANLKDELKNKTLQLSREVEVRDDPIKVLFVQAYPSYEFQYLKNLLERDRTLEFNVVLQEADIEYPEQDRYALPIFPVSRDALFQYDVLILGDPNLAYFSRSVLENIADFVQEKGGGLLFISGQRFQPADYAATPLANLLPIDWGDTPVPDTASDATDGFRLQPTLLGITSPHMQLGDTRAETESIWRALPEMYWLLEAPALKPGARVLAEHPTRTGSSGRKLPLMAVYYVPPGKVLWHGIDETYRWRFRIGDALYARYWVQAIRYLSRSKLLGSKRVELAADKLEYQRGTPVVLRVRFFDERLAPAADDGVSIVVDGGGKRLTVPLHRSSASRAIFEGTRPNLPIGKYTAWIAAPTLDKTPAAIRFKVVAPAGEAAVKEMDVTDMQKAADRSRGRFYDVQDMEEVIRNLPEGKPVKVASLAPIPLWNHWRVLLFFLTLLIVEWLTRKRCGML